MVGFDDKALVLFPKPEIYATKDLRYRAQFHKASVNLLAFLRSKYYTPHALVTDELAKIIPGLTFQFVSTLAPGDRFFASKNIDNCGNIMNLDLIEFPQYYKAADKKYPIVPDLSREERFEIICKREKLTAQAIIPDYKVVFYFYRRGYTNYKVTSKPDDGKIRVCIDAGTFIPTVYLSGMEQEPIDLLGEGFANRSILNWEV